MSVVESFWHEVVTAALLGTDRREPPTPPAGPLADVVADALRPDAAGRMLAIVASCAAARRAAFVPIAAADPLQPPDDDPRPWCPAPSVATWRAIVAEWPVLEDEWVLTVLERGYRLPPDALVELLARHRNDSVRRARVALAAGPLAAWVTAHVPALAASSRASVTADAVASLPALAVSPELAELLGADAHTFVRRLVPGVAAGAYGPAHRAVLVNLLARCRPAVLLDAAEALEGTHVGLALALADLARLRHRMLADLDP